MKLKATHLRCECEHISHFPSEGGADCNCDLRRGLGICAEECASHKPPTGHAYGDAAATRVAGHMDVCQACYDTCLKDYR